MSANPFADLHDYDDIDQDESGGDNDDTQDYNITEINNLADLAETIDKLIPSKNDKFFLQHFYDYNDYDAQEYESIMENRATYFDNNENYSIIATDIKTAILSIEPLEIRPLIEKCFENLFLEKPKCFGILFLLGIIVSQRPDLITPETFEFTLENAPIICWIIYKSLQSDKISHLDPLLSHQLIEIFLKEMLSTDKECDATAICAAHLIRDAFDRQKVYRISSFQYARLLQISMRQSTARECHVGHVLIPLMDKLSAIDKKSLAAQLMEVFPDAPYEVTELFIHEISYKGNVTFVDGWVEAHSSHRDASMRYLNAIAGKIPERIVCKFPKKDLLTGSNRVKLSVVQVELMNTSFRFCFFVLVALFIYLYFSRKGDK